MVEFETVDKDSELAKRLDFFFESLIEDGSLFRESESSESVVCLPVVSNGLADRHWIDQLASVLIGGGATTLYCRPADKDVLSYFSVVPVEPDLLWMYAWNSYFNWVGVSNSFDLQVLFTDAEYALFRGERTILESLTGKSIPMAFEDFRIYVTQESEWFRPSYEAVYLRYHSAWLKHHAP